MEKSIDIATDIRGIKEEGVESEESVQRLLVVIIKLKK
jgi:hypothetical protein